jgi:hypothetical protein
VHCVNTYQLGNRKSLSAFAIPTISLLSPLALEKFPSSFQNEATHGINGSVDFGKACGGTLIPSATHVLFKPAKSANTCNPDG